jgi:hypothetical protein
MRCLRRPLSFQVSNGMTNEMSSTPLSCSLLRLLAAAAAARAYCCCCCPVAAAATAHFVRVVVLRDSDISSTRLPSLSLRGSLILMTVMLMAADAAS